MHFTVSMNLLKRHTEREKNVCRTKAATHKETDRHADLDTKNKERYRLKERTEWNDLIMRNIEKRVFEIGIDTERSVVRDKDTLKALCVLAELHRQKSRSLLSKIVLDDRLEWNE